MAVWRKLAMLFIVFVGPLAITEAPAAAYPGDLAAGEYDNSTHEAGFGYFNDIDFSGFNVDVDDIVKAAKPVGAAWTSTESATVSVNIYPPGGGGFNGCYVLSPGQFTFDNQLGNASLHVTITADTQSCNSTSGIPTPFDVNVTWTGTAPL